LRARHRVEPLRDRLPLHPRGAAVLRPVVAAREPRAGGGVSGLAERGLGWIEQLEPMPSAVTIGKFDGVHIGHQRIIEQLRAVAAPAGLATTVVTFDRNPLEVVRPDRAPAPLVSLAHKIELLRDAGADRVVVVPFTP